MRPRRAGLPRNKTIGKSIRLRRLQDTILGHAKAGTAAQAHRAGNPRRIWPTGPKACRAQRRAIRCQPCERHGLGPGMGHAAYRYIRTTRLDQHQPPAIGGKFSTDAGRPRLCIDGRLQPCCTDRAQIGLDRQGCQVLPGKLKGQHATCGHIQRQTGFRLGAHRQSGCQFLRRPGRIGPFGHAQRAGLCGPLIADLYARIGRGRGGASPGGNPARLPQECHVIATDRLPRQAQPAIGCGPVEVIGIIGRIGEESVFRRQQRRSRARAQRGTRELPPVAGKDRQRRRWRRIRDHHARQAAQISRKAGREGQRPIARQKTQRVARALSHEPKGAQALALDGLHSTGVERRRQRVARQTRRQRELRHTFRRGQAQHLWRRPCKRPKLHRRKARLH